LAYSITKTIIPNYIFTAKYPSPLQKKKKKKKKKKKNMHVEESSKSSLLKLKDQYSHTVAMSFSREELEFSGGFN
jgi:hypothetical protein